CSGTAAGRRGSSRGGPPGRRGWRGWRSRGGGASRGREVQIPAGCPGGEPPGDQVLEQGLRAVAGAQRLQRSVGALEQHGEPVTRPDGPEGLAVAVSG